MRRFVATTSLILFVVWILPLGAFIDPAKEGKACGGQRAICLCSHLQGQHGPHKPMIANTDAHKEEGPSGGANHDFLVAVRSSLRDPSAASVISTNIPAYQFLCLRNIDHVPKA